MGALRPIPAPSSTGEHMSKGTLARLAAFGALAAIGALAAVYALFMFISYSTSAGIDRTQSAIAWLSVGLVFLALIAAHIYFARVLFGISRGERFGL
jgi:hypothetical protein